MLDLLIGNRAASAAKVEPKRSPGARLGQKTSFPTVAEIVIKNLRVSYMAGEADPASI
jgi:hypothetical protein